MENGSQNGHRSGDEETQDEHRAGHLQNLLDEVLTLLVEESHDDLGNDPRRYRNIRRGRGKRFGLGRLSHKPGHSGGRFFARTYSPGERSRRLESGMAVPPWTHIPSHAREVVTSRNVDHVSLDAAPAGR